MEDIEYIELIANGMKTKGDIEKRLELYTDAARRDFCMKLYGRIPMGNVPTPEEFEAGHIVSGLTPQQEFEMKNLEVALTHIESLFGISIFPMEPEKTTYTDQHEPEAYKSRKRGRPTYPIAFFILESDKDSLLKRMHDLMDGKTGKNALVIIKACVVIGYMTKPQYKAVVNEFGNICSQSCYNANMGENTIRTQTAEKVVYQNCNKFTEQEIESAIMSLKQT